MKILFIAPSDSIIPPPSNIIRASLSVATALAEGLSKKGHKVSFACPIGSTVKVNKIFTNTVPLISLVGKSQYYAIEDPSLRNEILGPFYFDLFDTVLKNIKQEKFDLIHIHTDLPLTELAVSSRMPIPSVFTLHTSPRKSDVVNSVIRLFNTPNNYFISISNQQRKQFPAIRFFDTVYNGIIINDYSFDTQGGDNLIFAGRLKRLKGVQEALQVALNTKHKLSITGDLSYSDKKFLDEDFLPKIEKNPKYLQYVGYTMKINNFYKQGKALLFPIQWEEPFGLVMIEAMATGTPVVAFARGSVPEVVKDGITGFIVNPSKEDIRGNWIIKKTGIEGLCEAVERIYGMSNLDYLQLRKNCRNRVETHFTAEKMVDDYEKVYQKILQSR